MCIRLTIGEWPVFFALFALGFLVAAMIDLSDIQLGIGLFFGVFAVLGFYFGARAEAASDRGGAAASRRSDLTAHA
jgi:mannose/fructose/N-acetylgalactosamine-specific phosphotransferase system component IIC